MDFKPSTLSISVQAYKFSLNSQFSEDRIDLNYTAHFCFLPGNAAYVYPKSLSS